MTLEATAGLVVLTDDGEGLWFNGQHMLVKVDSEQTQGKYSAVELRGRKGFGAPLHTHSNEDEFFIVLDGEVRFQLGDTVTETERGAVVYGPRDVPHSFAIDSDEASLLLLFGPGGNENFFREAGKPARAFGFPPADEEFMGREEMVELMRKFGSEPLGPPLPPK